jgi:hypothetical protein
MDRREGLVVGKWKEGGDSRGVVGGGGRTSVRNNETESDRLRQSWEMEGMSEMSEVESGIKGGTRQGKVQGSNHVMDRAELTVGFRVEGLSLGFRTGGIESKI